MVESVCTCRFRVTRRRQVPAIAMLANCDICLQPQLSVESETVNSAELPENFVGQ